VANTIPVKIGDQVKYKVGRGYGLGTVAGIGNEYGVRENQAVLLLQGGGHVVRGLDKILPKEKESE
jgi:hypothetical protein